MADVGYTTPTPIQEQAIPVLLKGRDLLGIAQTGTGKTAAFALPILHRLHASGQTAEPRSPRCLVLTPTRELALQVRESFVEYGAKLTLKSTCIFGGVGDAPQKKTLQRGVDILVATPGRLLDLLNQGAVHLKRLEIFVLDEADRMLDMGFIHDIRKVIATLPAERQNLFFSATMPRDIAQLASTILRDPTRVEVVPESTPIERIDQKLYYVEKQTKPLMLQALLHDESLARVLVFTRMKHVANRVCEKLTRVGINAAAIHGNKSQTRREEAMNSFRDGTLRVLVATDIAARGIDVEGVTHVVNYDLPDVPETYVHRIGRTARAGAEGFAISFCSSEERSELRDIQRLIRREIPLGEDLPPELLAQARAAEATAPPEEKRPVRSSRPRPSAGRPSAGRPSSSRRGEGSGGPSTGRPSAGRPSGEPKSPSDSTRRPAPRSRGEKRPEGGSPQRGQETGNRGNSKVNRTERSNSGNRGGRGGERPSSRKEEPRRGERSGRPHAQKGSSSARSESPERAPHPGAASKAQRLMIGLGKLFS